MNLLQRLHIAYIFDLRNDWNTLKGELQKANEKLQSTGFTVISHVDDELFNLTFMASNWEVAVIFDDKLKIVEKEYFLYRQDGSNFTDIVDETTFYRRELSKILNLLRE